MTTFQLALHFATDARGVIEVWEGSEFIAAIYPGDEPRTLRIISKNRIAVGEPDIRPPANGITVSIGDGL